MAPEIRITVNGECLSFAAEATLLDVLRALNVEPERVAIELNREIVKRDRWATTSFCEGAGIEVVQFVGGG